MSPGGRAPGARRDWPPPSGARGARGSFKSSARVGDPIEIEIELIDPLVAASRLPHVKTKGFDVGARTVASRGRLAPRAPSRAASGRAGPCLDAVADAPGGGVIEAIADVGSAFGRLDVKIEADGFFAHGQFVWTRDASPMGASRDDHRADRRDLDRYAKRFGGERRSRLRDRETEVRRSRAA